MTGALHLAFRRVQSTRYIYSPQCIEKIRGAAHRDISINDRRVSNDPIECLAYPYSSRRHSAGLELADLNA